MSFMIHFRVDFTNANQIIPKVGELFLNICADRRRL
jgi:hypothetical protein